MTQTKHIGTINGGNIDLREPGYSKLNHSKEVWMVESNKIQPAPVIILLHVKLAELLCQLVVCNPLVRINMDRI